MNAGSAQIVPVINEHLHLVYSAALRQTGDPHLAEDITQAVFILFMRKHHSIAPTYVAGWLIKAAYFASRQAKRAERRRQYHEKRAAMQKQELSIDVATELAPVLDKALARLAARPRTAVVLRYLEGRSVGDIAQHLHVTENAASKIISRGVTKLRRILSSNQCDFAIAPTNLVTTLRAIGNKNSTPDLSHLAQTIFSRGIAPITRVSGLAHATSKFMLWAKIQLVFLCLAGVTFAAAIGLVTAHEFAKPKKVSTPIFAATISTTKPLSSGIVIRDFGYRLKSPITLPLPTSANGTPVSTFISLERQQIVIPPVGLIWNPTSPSPFNSATEKWLEDNNVDLLFTAAGQNIRIYGIRAAYIPADASPENTSSDAAERALTKASNWHPTFHEPIVLPFKFYVRNYSEKKAVAEIVPNANSPANYLFNYRLIEPDPTKPRAEHLVLADSEFLYARTYSTPSHIDLRITVAGDRLRQLGQTDHYYTGGLFLNGRILTVGWFDLADRTFNSDILSVIDATRERAQDIANQLNQATPDNGYKRFVRLYSLNDNEPLRYIAPPYIPERQIYANYPLPLPPNAVLTLGARGSEITGFEITVQNPRHPITIPVASILNAIGGVKNYEIMVDPSLPHLSLSGDFVVNDSASTESKLRALQALFSRQFKRTIKIEKKIIPRQIILAMGTYDFTPLPSAEDADAISLRATVQGRDQRDYSGDSSLQKMFDELGEEIGMRMVGLVENTPSRVRWIFYNSASIYNSQTQTTAQVALNALLQNLSIQTNLDFKIVTRNEPTYIVTASP